MGGVINICWKWVVVGNGWSDQYLLEMSSCWKWVEEELCFLCISRLLWNRYSGLRMEKAWYQIRCSSCYGGVHPIRSDLHGQLRISVPRSPNMIVNRSILPNSLFRSTRGISFPNSRNRSGMNRKHNSICFRCLGWGTLSCLFSSLSGFSSESALPS